MKIYMVALLSFALLQAHAQPAAIHGRIGGGTGAKTVSVYRPVKGFMFDYFKEAFREVPVKEGTFDISLPVDEPEIMKLYIEDSSGNDLYRQYLFLQKGYNLDISLVHDGKNFHMATRGVGANDNQALAIPTYHSLDSFYREKDTLPFSVYQYLVKAKQADSTMLAAYISKYKPSPAFKEVWKYQLRYSVPADFFNFSENYKYSLRDAYTRNLAVWHGLQEKLFAQAPLQDEHALSSPYYRDLIKTYLMRKKERLWTEFATNPVAIREWYGADTAKGMQEFNEDQTNRLQQKIAERIFNGKVREYAYAIIMESALHSSLITNLSSVYADFTDAFPNSPYHAQFRPALLEMFKKAARPLTDKMIFVKEGSKLADWESVLALMKGKTVLLDMWGTWCGPCREEMEKHSAYIKDHFREKGLDYLYIANYDENRDAKWKELLAYFGLDGYHILANQGLSKDIMKKIKGTGYPTYAIIKPDGSFELSKAGYPMDREKLIEQIEAALK